MPVAKLRHHWEHHGQHPRAMWAAVVTCSDIIIAAVIQQLACLTIFADLAVWHNYGDKLYPSLSIVKRIPHQDCRDECSQRLQRKAIKIEGEGYGPALIFIQGDSFASEHGQGQSWHGSFTVALVCDDCNCQQR